MPPLLRLSCYDVDYDYDMMHRTVLNVVIRLRHVRFKGINPTPNPPSMHLPLMMIMEAMLVSSLMNTKIRMPTFMKEAGYSR